MRRVLSVAPNLDDRAFDALVQAATAEPEDGNGGPVLVDARHVRWADPYGMIGLLALGHHLSADGARPALQLPEAPEVVSYLGRMGFLRLADEVFEVHGGPRPRRTG